MAQDTSQAHFEELKEWSERKQKVIRNYLDGAARIFGSTYVATYYVDGFAGAGLYGTEGGTQKPGSPLKAAELAHLYHERKYKMELRCITVEENLDNFRALQVATSTFGNLVKNLHGTFADHLDQILHLTRGYPLVCFLDPFGIKGIELNTIQKLVDRQSPTDIWLRFDVPYVLRKWGFLQSNSADAPGHRRLLKQIYGIYNEQTLYDSIQGKNTEARQKNALELYKKQLYSVMTNINKREAYVESYRIRSLEQEEKYHLIFGCNHSRAITLASDIVYNVEEAYQEQIEEKRVTETGQLSWLTLPESKDALSADKLGRLEEDILRLCKGKRMSCNDVHCALINKTDKWFGVIKYSHIRQALNSLQRKNLVTPKGRLSEQSTLLDFG